MPLKYHPGLRRDTEMLVRNGLRNACGIFKTISLSRHANTGMCTGGWTWRVSKGRDGAAGSTADSPTSWQRKSKKERVAFPRSLSAHTDFTLGIWWGFTLQKCWKQGDIYETVILWCLRAKQRECEWKPVQVLTRAQTGSSERTPGRPKGHKRTAFAGVLSRSGEPL